MNKKKTVRIEVNAGGTLGLPLLNPLQGKLKSLSDENYEKLKKEIVEDGFSFAFSVWESKDDGKTYILDGHQRLTALTKMQKEGYTVPEVPVNFVQARDLKQAMRKLLAGASQYGKIEKDGLAEFLERAQITTDELVASFNFADLDIQQFVSSSEDLTDIAADLGQDMMVVGEGVPMPKDEAPTKNSPPPIPPSSQSQVRLVQLFFNSETQPEFLKMCAKLQEVGEYENLTDTVMGVVREAYKSLGKNKK